jgi:hypothetical protein
MSIVTEKKIKDSYQCEISGSEENFSSVFGGAKKTEDVPENCIFNHQKL